VGCCTSAYPVIAVLVNLYYKNKQPVSPRREGIMQKYTYMSITIRTKYAYSINMSDLR
jgi:hypothetical protein